MKFATRIIVLTLPIALTACAYIPKPSFIQARDKHYLTAKSVPPLRMPPGTSSNAIHSEYPVSYREYPEASKDVSLKPPGIDQQ